MGHFYQNSGVGRISNSICNIHFSEKHRIQWSTGHSSN